MEDSYSQNQNWQLECQLVEGLDFSSPRVNPEIAELPLNQSGFQIDSNYDISLNCNHQDINTNTYDSTNSNRQPFDPKIYDVIYDEDGPYTFVKSIKSQQMQANFSTIFQNDSLKPSNSAQTPMETKIYQQQNRTDKLNRYKQKKQRRIFGKRLTYPSRKRVADQRQRVAGRFQKEQIQQKTQSNHIEFTPKKPRQTIGIIQSFGLSNTKSSAKSKR